MSESDLPTIEGLDSESEQVLREGCTIKVSDYLEDHTVYDLARCLPTKVLFQVSYHLTNHLNGEDNE